MRQGLRGDRPIPGAHGLAYHTIPTIMYYCFVIVRGFRRSSHSHFHAVDGWGWMRDEVTDMSCQYLRVIVCTPRDHVP